MAPEEIEAVWQQRLSKFMNDACQLRDEASRLLAAAHKAETSTPQTDTQTRKLLATIAAHCNDILRALDGVDRQNGGS